MADTGRGKDFAGRRFGLARMRIGAKLVLAPGVAQVLLVVLALTAWRGLSRQERELADIYKVESVQVVGVGAVAEAVARCHAGIYQLLSQVSAHYPEAQIEAAGKRLQEELEAVRGRLEGLQRGGASGKDPAAEGAEQAQLTAIRTDLAAYAKAVGEVIEIAAVDQSTATALMSATNAKFLHLSQLLVRLREAELARGEAAYGRAVAGSRAMQLTLLATLILSGLLSVLVTGFVRSDILQSAASIRLAAVDLRAGRLHARAEVRGGDEIGEAAVAFNEAVDALRGALLTVVGSAGRLDKSARTLEEVGGQQTAAVEGASGKVQSAAATAMGLGFHVQEVTTGARDMAAAVEGIGRDVGQVTRSTAAAVAQTHEALEAIANLGRAGEEIGEVVKLINTIARQTNLLSLNATIEAARAGAAGAGFAVVAHEVKELASQTGAATTEIGRRVAAIQGGTRTSVEAVRRVAQVLDEANGLQGRVGAVVEKEQIAAEGVARSAIEATNGAESLTSVVTSLAGAIDAASSAAVASGEAARGLAGVADELRHAVERFRLDAA